MKIQYVSDLHIDFDFDFDIDVTNAEVLVVAGDIINNDREMVVTYIKSLQEVHDKPLVFVPGNHDFYGYELNDTCEFFEESFEKIPGVYYIDGKYTVIGDTVFVGGTLWTNFEGFNGEVVNKALGVHGLADFKWIGYGDRAIRPDDMIVEHYMALDKIWEADMFGIERNLNTVVVTHHGPHQNSIHPRFQGNHLNPCFVSMDVGLQELDSVKVWIHGHVHNRMDYTVGKVRVLTNPRGYPGERTGFDSAATVEV